MFSNSEYYEMIMCVGHEDGNLSRARELYRQRFIDGRPAARACCRGRVLREPGRDGIPAWRCASPFRTSSTRAHQRSVSARMDRPWGACPVASSITGPDASWLLPVGLREGQSVCYGLCNIGRDGAACAVSVRVNYTNHGAKRDTVDIPTSQDVCSARWTAFWTTAALIFCDWNWFYVWKKCSVTLSCSDLKKRKKVAFVAVEQWEFTMFLNLR